MIIELNQDDATALAEAMRNTSSGPVGPGLESSAYRTRVANAVDSSATDLAAAVERLRHELTPEEWRRIALAGAQAKWGKK